MYRTLFDFIPYNHCGLLLCLPTSQGTKSLLDTEAIVSAGTLISYLYFLSTKILKICRAIVALSVVATTPALSDALAPTNEGERKRLHQSPLRSP